VASELVGETLAEIETPVGYDSEEFLPFIVDSLGRIILLLGWDGSTAVPLKVNTSGQLEVECKGAA